MPTKPSNDDHSEAVPPGTSAQDIQPTKPPPPLERSRFGGSERRHEHPVDDDDAPV